MRLTPKSIFSGIVAVGLPLAVTVGWILAEPADPGVSISAPAGSGTIGKAPREATSATSDRATGYRPTPSASASASPSVSATSVAPITPATPSPSLPITLSPLPTLTDPPVPTPTVVTSEPPSPSATPSTSESPEGLPLGLVRNEQRGQ